MANTCLPQVQACALRVTRLDANGVPTPGADNMYVSDALTSLAFAWEVEEGTSIREKNACDAVVVDYQGPDELVRGNMTITLLTPDPELSEILSGGSVLTAAAAVGYAAPPIGIMSASPVSIEVWAKRIRDGKLDTTHPYAWWAYPWVQDLRPGDHEHTNANLGASFMGKAFENENWFDGPLNDWPAASDRVYQWLPTTTLPTVQCGYAAVAAS